LYTLMPLLLGSDPKANVRRTEVDPLVLTSDHLHLVQE